MINYTIILLAIGLSADAFAVSLSSGLLIKILHFNKALKIALFFGVFQGIMPLIGWAATFAFQDIFASFDHWIAFILLAFIGGKMLYESFKDEEDAEKFNPLDNYTLIGLSVATSIDALAAGLSLGLLKMSILLAVSIISLITFILSFCGVFIGHKFGNLFGSQVERMGGIILIFLGFKIVWEHLFLN